MASPLVPAQSLTFYRLQFKVSGELPIHWEAVSCGADGTFLGDHYSQLFEASGGEDTHYTRTKMEAARIGIRVLNETTPFYLEAFSIGRADSQEVLNWADGVYSQMPVLNWKPTPDRWRHIENFQAMLTKGGVLRVVMLGDSIVNDSSNSPWDLMLERDYPGLRLEIIASVSNGGSCRYYKDNDRVASYVTRFHPDLVIIGGISHHGDTEAIRSVIRQIRAQNKAEILLMSGAFGPGNDPRALPGWNPDPAAAPDSFRARLQTLADEEQTGFFDLEGVWGNYIRESEKPLEWFKRDNTHANDYGAQLLGRILERFFAPS